MRRDYPQHMGSEVAQIKRAIQDLQSGRLQNASMHGTRLYIYDDDGDIREIIGNQGDGSYGSRVIQSPPQPTPTAPILSVGEGDLGRVGSVSVEWDGGIAQGSLPQIHGHLEVFKQRLTEGQEPDFEQALFAGTIRDRDGGVTSITCQAAGTWAVWLVMVGADRVTRGDESEPSLIERVSLVDTDAIKETIQDSIERLEAEKAERELAIQELKNTLEDLNVEGLPDLAEELEENSQRLAEARQRLDSVEDEIRVNVDDLAARIATVIQLHAGRITAGQIGVERLNVMEFFGDTGVLNLLRASVVETLDITAERGFIGGALLEDNSITVDKIVVTEELVAALGQFLYVQAGQIDVNNLVAESALVGLLEAVGLVLSNQAGRRRFEVSGDGFRLTDTENDQVLAQLGTQSDDLLSLHDSETGDPVITMTQDGGISAQHLSSERDPHLGGKPLAGEVFESPRWFSATSVMESLPQGIIAQHLRTFSSSDNTTISASVAVEHLEVRLKPGRLYRIGCDGFEMGSRDPYFMEAFYTSSDTDSRPGMPHSGSVSLGQHQGGFPPSGGNTNLGYEVMFNALTTRRIRVMFAIGVRGGGSKAFGSQARNNARFYIEDIGPSIGFTGRSMLRSASTTSNIIPEIPEAVTQRYQVAGTATYSFDASTGVATRQQIGGVPRFGVWQFTGQTHFTVVQFAPWNQSGTPTGARMGFRVDRWGTARGNVVRNWLPSFTGLPASFNLDQLTELPVQRNVGSSSIRSADLTREQEMDLAGSSNASIVLGGSGWGAPNYAGAGVFTSSGVTASLSTEIEE